MGIFEEYESYFNKYQKIYGARSIVLYQNGMFFEVYGVDNEKEKVGLVKEISDLLNIQMTRRSKAILENSRSNFLMAGFPLNQVDRYISLLTEDNGYVVAVVEQVTPSPNPKRAVTYVVSPGTNIKYLSNPNSSYLMSIYIEYESQKVNQVKPINMLTIGLSAIDVSTGQSLVYEVGNSIDDENRAFDETYRLIQTLEPKELMVNSRNFNMNEHELIAKLDLSTRLVHCIFNNVPADYCKLSYQNEFLKKVFPQTGMLKPIEFIDLEKSPTAVISYILLLNFCHNQNETIINKIERPVVFHHEQHLILDNNCINQLNLTSTDNLKSSNVINLTDQTSTPMGRRIHNERIKMPLFNYEKIQKRYDYIEAFRTPITLKKTKLKHLDGHQQHYLFQLFEPHLNQINDIERYQRKICHGLLQPSEFPQLHNSYCQILDLGQALESPEISIEPSSTLAIKSSSSLFPVQYLVELKDFIKYYQKIIDLTEISKYNLNNVAGSFFNRGYNSEIDTIQDQINDHENFFIQLSKAISGFISAKSETLVTYEKSNDEYYLEVTNVRYNTFLANCKGPISIKTAFNNYQINQSDFEVIKNRTGKNCKLTSEQIHKISQNLIESREALLNAVVKVYLQFLSEIYAKYHPLMKKLVEIIADIDYYKSGAKTSLLYNYCRPSVETPQTGNVISSSSILTPSYISAKQIRHPLIERFQENSKYVPHDLDLRNNQSGILLFGTNCSGKSSLMKTIGLLVILAQAGLYVPATQFCYSLYKTILTRIIGNDNLFKGLSSFAVEMGELRGILKRANSQSLVLGDEICHGTETVSAVSLVAAAIISLSKSATNFVFATHLHQLSQIERINGLETLKIYHLKVKFDETTGNLIYDRRLEEGPGHPIYGLEVARAMDLDRNFIELANDIRKEIMEVGALVPIKKSKYNKEVYLNKCGIPDCNEDAEDTHHIEFQSNADDRGFIDCHLQKNHKSNLIPLCKKCHKMVHTNQPGQTRYLIYGYQMTNEGSKLNYSKEIVQLQPKEIVQLQTKEIVQLQTHVVQLQPQDSLPNVKKKITLNNQLKLNV
jgi:DNA mismatch repair protein MutS